MPINIVTCQVHPVLVKRIKCTVCVLSLPGAQGGLLETLPHWHATIGLVHL